MRSHITILAFILAALTACANSPTTAPDITVVDFNTYRSYITDLQANVARGDETSFAPGERERMTRLSGELITSLAAISSFDELSSSERAKIIDLNAELHVLLVGEDESQAAQRICRTAANTGSNIRSRTCYTRDEISRDRVAVQRLLEERSDEIERLRQNTNGDAVGFGTPSI